jgi:hypothetical protein
MIEFRYVVYGVVITKRGNEMHSIIAVHDNADDADREAYYYKKGDWHRTYVIEEGTHFRKK